MRVRTRQSSKVGALSREVEEAAYKLCVQSFIALFAFISISCEFLSIQFTARKLDEFSLLPSHKETL
jgi:hypothetical protein